MIRDTIIVEDALGNEQEFGVEGLFELDDESFVLLSHDDERLLFRLEGEGEEQVLVGLEDPELLESLLDAYQLAVEAAPAEDDPPQTH